MSSLKLYEVLSVDDQARIQREGIVLQVVTDCGGISASSQGVIGGGAAIHNPRACKQPFCGQYRATRGSERSYGRTPLMALRRLPA